jgi:hypothetical protein
MSLISQALHLFLLINAPSVPGIQLSKWHTTHCTVSMKDFFAHNWSSIRVESGLGSIRMLWLMPNLYYIISYQYESVKG